MAISYLPQLREKRVSIRLMWPFLRIIQSAPSPLTMQILEQAGIGAADLAKPDTRLPHRLVMAVLQAWVDASGDHEVGLRAGSSMEAGDLDTIEHAARSCATVRECLELVGRYVHLVHEAVEISIVDYGEHALWRCRVTDGVPQPRAANDFVVVAAARFGRRCAQVDGVAREVHFMHSAPADTSVYSAFTGALLKFDMPHNGFVVSRNFLAGPTRGANPRLHAVFDKYARELSERAAVGTRNRARDAIVERLGSGEMCMEAVAAALAMSVPTLRRRLEDEGTTFTDLVDEVRRDLAERYLRDPQRSIGEIATLLGFAHAPAFHKAFRRWKGVTPSEHRSRI
jgi:AraC-like DNA-binding protein